MFRGRPRTGVLAIVLAFAVLAGCSSGGDDNGATAGSSSDDYPESAANVELLLAGPTGVGVAEDLTDPPPSDVNAIYLQCPVPECTDYGDGINDATDALGWNLTRINFDLTPESAQSAFDQALAENPDVIYSVAAPPEWFTAQRKAAREAGVVFIDFANVYEADASEATGGYGGVEDPPDGLLQGADHQRWTGEQLADFAIAESGGNVNALTVFVPDFPSGIPPSRGFAERLEEVCPETCSSKDLEIAVTDIGTTLPQKVSSELQRDPNINFIFFISGSFASGVAPAIVELGMQGDVTMIGNAPVPANLEEMVNGQVEQAWIGFNSSLLGWRMVDMSVRALQGEEIAEKATGPDDTTAAAWPPVKLLTKDNHPEPVEFTGPEGYEDMFKQMWGLD